MTDILPVTHAEELKNIKQIFEITLDKYNQCLKRYASSQNKEDKSVCNSYEKKLNEILNHDMFLLQNNISKDIDKMNTTMKQSENNINSNKKKYVQYNKKKKLFTTDADLASEPHKTELFQVKIWRFVVLAYYFFGILAIMYFFKKRGQAFGFADKISNAIYNFRNILITLVG